MTRPAISSRRGALSLSIRRARQGRRALWRAVTSHRLENLPAVSNAFGFAAGFNLQLWPFLQDLPQLEIVYGKKGMSILANCGMLQFFTPTEIETANYLRRRGGMK